MLGDEHPSTLNTMGNLALLYEDTGWVVEAKALYVEALAARIYIRHARVMHRFCRGQK